MDNTQYGDCCILWNGGAGSRGTMSYFGFFIFVSYICFCLWLLMFIFVTLRNNPSWFSWGRMLCVFSSRWAKELYLSSGWTSCCSLSAGNSNWQIAFITKHICLLVLLLQLCVLLKVSESKKLFGILYKLFKHHSNDLANCSQQLNW